jgi:hypothetical protein
MAGNGGASSDLGAGLIGQASIKSNMAHSSEGADREAEFTYHGSRVLLTMDEEAITWKLTGKSRRVCAPCRRREGRGATRTVGCRCLWGWLAATAAPDHAVLGMPGA